MAAFIFFSISIASWAERRNSLAHRDEKKRFCIYTDSSDSHRYGITTQVAYKNRFVPLCKQNYDPLSFHSGCFSATQLGWSTLKREVFAVLLKTKHLHWLTAGPSGFSLHTDNNNSICILNPTAIMIDIGQAALPSVLHWVFQMSSYNYVCTHINGEDNNWTELHKRWFIPFITQRRITIAPLLTTFQDFTWLSLDIIRTSKSSHFAKRRSDLVLDIVCVWHKTDLGAIYIPLSNSKLQLRLEIIAHIGTVGHQ